MKKILLLGGSAQQVAAIRTAKALGYDTVLCDYLADNPGQYAADRFCLVSTTDKEAVLEVARKERVDGVLAYASDPAAPTAAYVAEQLGLPGNPYESVQILCNKDRFRAFLKLHGFHTPEAKGYDRVADALRDLARGQFRFPVITKPVDSSGSKGVGRIDTPEQAAEKLEYAMSFSRAKRIVVEEYVEKTGYQIAGDGFSLEGRLVFRCFADDHFDPKGKNPFVPISASFPCSLPEQVQEKVHAEIQRLLTALDMRTCAYNFDIRIGRDGNIYLMEVAPRDGGNYIPDVIRYATGVDLAAASVKAAMGEPVGLSPAVLQGFYAYYAVHSLKEGVLREVRLTEKGRQHLLEDHLICKPGDRVRAFTGANTALGCLVMRFDCLEQMLEMMDHSDRWIEVVLE